MMKAVIPARHLGGVELRITAILRGSQVLTSIKTGNTIGIGYNITAGTTPK